MGRTRKADLARSELAKEAAKLKVDLQTGESPALQSLDQPADDLAREMEKLKIKNTPSPSVPEEILTVLTYHEMLLSIPASIHPAVRDFLSKTFLECCEVEEIGNKKLVKFLPLVSKANIKEKLSTISSRAEMSMSLFLAPPVSHCIKVRVIVCVVFFCMKFEV